jgi:threonyl-tRNA synthetase
LSIYIKVTRTATIRERLQDYIRYADDKKVKTIYTMVEDEIIETKNLWEDKQFLAEMNSRLEDLESGKVEGISWEELKAKF